MIQFCANHRNPSPYSLFYNVNKTLTYSYYSIYRENRLPIMTAGLSKRQLYYITTVLHCIEIKNINVYVYISFGTHLFLSPIHHLTKITYMFLNNTCFLIFSKEFIKHLTYHQINAIWTFHPCSTCIFNSDLSGSQHV